MKTSNKLLLVLVALIIAVPLLMLLSFRSAIKADKFTLKTYGDGKPTQTVLKPFKVLKIASTAPQLLNCTIKSGDTYAYRFNQYLYNAKGDADSCTISYVGDTLVLAYNRINKDENEITGSNDIELTVPAIAEIISNGATITINAAAVNKQPVLNFNLSQQAALNINGIDKETFYTFDSSNQKTDEQQKKMPVLQSINIQSTDAVVNINNVLKINILNAYLNNASRLNLSEDASIDTLSGSISEKAIINAPYRYIKKLKVAERD